MKNPLLWDHKANKGTAVSSEPVAAPAGPADAAGALTVEHPGTVPAGAKTAETDFQLIRVDAASGTSLVRCTPKTGRSHQLRIHLALLGFPIANDHQYGGSLGAARPAYMLRRPGDNAEERRAVAARRVHAAAGGAVASGVAAASSDAGRGGTIAEVEDEIGPAKRARAAGGAAQGPPAVGESTPVATRDGGEPVAGDAEAASPARKVARSSTPAGPSSAETRPRSPDDTADHAVVKAGGANAPAAPAMGDPAAAPRVVDAGSAEAEAAWGTRSDAASAPELVPEARRDPLCPHCPSMSPRDYPLDLQPLWLHAETYSSDAWAFSAPLPAWAAADFLVPGGTGAGVPPA